MVLWEILQYITLNHKSTIVKMKTQVIDIEIKAIFPKK